MLEPIIYSSLAWINNRLFSITQTTRRLRSLLTCFGFYLYSTQTHDMSHDEWESERFNAQSEREYWVTQKAKQGCAVLSYGCSAFLHDMSHYLEFWCLQEGPGQTLHFDDTKKNKKPQQQCCLLQQCCLQQQRYQGWVFGNNSIPWPWVQFLWRHGCMTRWSE